MVEAMMPGDGAVMKVSANGLPSPAIRWTRAISRSIAAVS